ncbi:MAG: C1 family peptidase [bacterium]
MKKVILLFLFMVTVSFSYSQSGIDDHPLGVVPFHKTLYTNPETYPAASRAVAYPSSYDLRTYGRMTSVKNQGGCGSCWTFGTYGSIESRWKSIGMADFDLSENNLKDCHGFDYSACFGGHSWMSISYLSRRSGALIESQDPYVPAPATCVTGITPTGYEANASFLPNDIGTIKQKLMEYGAIYTVFYWDAAYYNAVDYTYFYNGTQNQNHGVTIAGWDDTKNTAGGTGAWLIKNSWGASWGNSGYFWISYNDSKINSEVCYYPTFLSYNASSKLYLYDELGEVEDIGYSSNTAWALNKFVMTNSLPLTRLGTWIASGNGTVDFEVYDNFNGTTLTNLLTSMTGISVPYAGYYTFDLPAPVALSSGNDIYIKVKYYTPGYNLPIPVESVFPGYSSNAVIQSSVAWISPNGTNWSPIGNGTSYPYDLCVRAYTATESPAPVTTANNALGCPGNNLLLPLTVAGFNSITSFSLRLEYDTTNLNYISFANANPQLTNISVTEENVSGTTNKLTIRWNGATPQTITSGGKLLDLNLYYAGGTTALNFNNSSNYGMDCEYADQNRSPLFDNPTATYYVNGQVTLDTTIQPTISGPVQLCYHTTTDSYSTEPDMNSYTWTVSPGGSFVGPTDTNAVQVQWQTRGSHTVTVNYTTPSGCTAPVPDTLSVQIDSLPFTAGVITGTATICIGDPEVVYSVDSIPFASTYIWSLPPGATIISGEYTNVITVSFSTTAESGNFLVYGNNTCGNGTSSPSFPVTVMQPPYPPVIEQQGDSLVSDFAAGNQWYNLSGPIAGATGRYYAPQVNDYYYDIVTENGCSSAASNMVYFVLTGVADGTAGAIRVFPNPARDILYIDIPLTSASSVTAGLISSLGKDTGISQSRQLAAGMNNLKLDISGLENGIYLLQIKGISPGAGPVCFKVMINR